MTKQFYSVGGEILGESSGSGAMALYLTDALGSVTTTSANTASTSRYSPFGEKGSAPANASLGWVGSRGYRPTARNYSSHYMQARHYAAPLASWTAIDPLWPSENAYGYVGGSPVQRVDSSGLNDVILLGHEVINRGCPPEFATAVAYICSLIRAGFFDSKLQELDGCVRATVAAGNPKNPGAARNCQQFSHPKYPKNRIRCMKNFCNRGFVKCEDPGGGAAGLTKMVFGWGCPWENSDKPQNQWMKVDPRGGADIFWPGQSGPYAGAQKTDVGGTFLHELLHACGVDHVLPPQVEDKSYDELFCNNILTCCMQQLIHKYLAPSHGPRLFQPVKFRGHLYEFCPYWYARNTGPGGNITPIK